MLGVFRHYLDDAGGSHRTALDTGTDAKLRTHLSQEDSIYVRVLMNDKKTPQLL